MAEINNWKSIKDYDDELKKLNTIRNTMKCCRTLANTISKREFCWWEKVIM